MTCRECLNFNVCSAGGNTPRYSEKEKVEMFCRFFKRKAEWKKVVLCVECRFCSINDGFPSAPPWCRNPHALLQYSDIPPGWFCPLGEKKEK